jgi:thioredoxin-like negative regulator of GroEL
VFFQLLQANPGLIIIKLGASWCKPCKKISPALEKFFASSPEEVICADLDVDECVDLYSFFKSKKMVNGIPAVLCYNKGNHTYIPNDSNTGADQGQLAAFFTRCGNNLAKLQYEEKVSMQINNGDHDK